MAVSGRVGIPIGINGSKAVMVKKKMASLFDNDVAKPDAQQEVVAKVSVEQEMRKQDGASKTISDLYVPDAMIAIKEATNCESLEALKERLIQVLGQNSAETRLRNARFIIRWFFPDGIDGIARKTWSAYGDDRILLDVLRYLYLLQEPVMGKCVTDCLFPIELGMRVPASEFDRFLASYYSAPATKKTTQRLKTNLIKLGILEVGRGRDHLLVQLVPTKTALLILTHSIFAPAGPRTVELKRLLADPYWKYLGFKSEDAVRTVFREADAAGILGKYVVADQLEQITTRWGLDELLSNKPRM
jgi:hypothetical protein